MSKLTDKVAVYYAARESYETAKALSDSAHRDMKRAANEVSVDDPDESCWVAAMINSQRMVD